MMALGGQTVTVVARTRDDLTGDIVDGARTPVSGCSVQPQSVSEDSGTGGGAAQATQRIRVFGPVELRHARPDDVVEVDGWQFGQHDPVRLQVIGSPMVWPDMIGRPHHVEADLSLVTG